MPRERRDASVLALSHRPSRVASNSPCRGAEETKRKKKKKRERVHPRACSSTAMCMSNAPQPLSRSSSHHWQPSLFSYLNDCHLRSRDRDRSVAREQEWESVIGSPPLKLTRRKKKKRSGSFAVSWRCIRRRGSWKQRVPLEALRRQSRSIAARRCRKVKVSADAAAAVTRAYCALPSTCTRAKSNLIFITNGRFRIKISNYYLYIKLIEQTCIHARTLTWEINSYFVQITLYFLEQTRK